MTSEIEDTCRAAQELIDRHGALALSVAARRVTELVAQGNIEGAAAWALILERIKALTKPPDEHP